LEQQTLKMESAQVQANAVSAISHGVKAQKEMNAEMSIDKVDMVVEDMQEQQDIQNEIAKIFELGAGSMEDDDPLDEFNELMMEEELDDFIAAQEMSNPTEHPAVAQKEPSTPNTENDPVVEIPLVVSQPELKKEPSTPNTENDPVVEIPLVVSQPELSPRFTETDDNPTAHVPFTVTQPEPVPLLVEQPKIMNGLTLDVAKECAAPESRLEAA